MVSIAFVTEMIAMRSAFATPASKPLPNKIVGAPIAESQPHKNKTTVTIVFTKPVYPNCRSEPSATRN